MPKQPPIDRPSAPALLAALIAAAALAGCASDNTRIDAGPVYPTRLLPAAETLDIQVFRDGQHIELTNTTARSFGPSWLWLNGRFGLQIEGLAIGQTLRLPLRSFRDEFGEPFRAGGFFATEKPERLVLAEIQTGDTLAGLVVVGPVEALLTR